MTTLLRRMGLVLGFWALAGLAAPAQVFSDQTSSAGAQFTHHAPSLDGMALGAGAAFGDYDGDGDLDLYVCDRSGPNRLLQNQGGPAGFVDVAAVLNVELTAADCNGALFTDYDNDGDQDLYVLGRGDNVMLRNDGAAGGGLWNFTDVTAELGVQAFGRSLTAAFGDYDGDGWLDLYVANHSYPPDAPLPGQPFHSDFLFRSLPGGGGGRIFADVSHLLDATLLQTSIAHSVGFVDHDEDGDLDIFVANEVDFGGMDPSITGKNFLWRNDGSDGSGGWQFTEAAFAAGWHMRRHPMGLAIADFNRDGHFDLATTDVGPNHLFVHQGDGTFLDQAAASGVGGAQIPGTNDTQIGWGLVALDHDLDGDEDLYVGTGYWLPVTVQPNRLYDNDGVLSPGLAFTEVSQGGGADAPQRSRCVIRGDYDGDGDEDLYVVNFDGDAHLYRNDQVGGEYLILRLVGTRSNRDALGAVARISRAGFPTQVRLAQSGSTTGGGHGKDLHFGVTGWGLVDLVTIDWPSGLQTQLANVTLNQLLEIEEPCPAESQVYGTGWPGTLGVPTLAVTSAPLLGMPLSIALGNSQAATTVALLQVGLGEAYLPSSWGGVLLVTPILNLVLPVGPQGTTYHGMLPSDPALCGRSLYLQILLADPGASQGLAASPGLQLLMGNS